MDKQPEGIPVDMSPIDDEDEDATEKRIFRLERNILALMAAIAKSAPDGFGWVDMEDGRVFFGKKGG